MKMFFTAVFILLVSTMSFAATYTVSSNGDTPDFSIADGICADVSGNCTLRAAVQESNALPSDDVINFASNVSAIVVETQLVLENNGSLVINGRGANVLTISKNSTPLGRIFRSNLATLTITDVTLTGGRVDSDRLGGGALYAAGGAVTLERVYITGNSLNSSRAEGAVNGGGIVFNGGTHNILNSTISNNYAFGSGGGIANSGTLTITNSTISENSAQYTSGGGISNSGNLTLRNVTIAGNSAGASCISACTGDGGGVYQSAGSTSFVNTIISSNFVYTIGSVVPPGPPEISFTGAFTSLGNNFVGDSAGDSTYTRGVISYQVTDIRDIPPQLSPLANYGGTTPTRALLSSSAAVNAGNDSVAPPTDQRGVARIAASDIGAYEFNGSSLSIIGRVISSAGNTGVSGVTVTLSGTSSATTTTNANGEYSFAALPENGNYVVTPSLAGYNFAPQSAGFTNLTTNQTANFTLQCAYSLTPTSTTLSSSPSSSSFNITTAPGCGWTASSNAAWISVGNITGSGSGIVNFSVLQNTGGTRTGTINVGGQIFTVTQQIALSLSINSLSLFEGNSGTTPFPFTVTLSTASAQTVSVNYATVNGTATPPTDYQGVSGILTFAPGETTKVITVLVNGDTTVEPNETFTVNLSGAVNAVISVAQGTGVIRNDEGRNYGKLFDFDGDGASDVAVFRPSNGFWYMLRSADNTFSAVQFGQAGDQIAPADYDGDGKTDIAVFREGAFGYFYILNSSDNSFRFAQFGTTGDVPMSGDWDGDGKADLAVYRAAATSGAQSNFYYRPTSQKSVDYYTLPLGTSTDRPLRGDFDGDGRLDPAVFRPSNSSWIILRSSLNQISSTSFGLGTDTPVPADFDGDGITNIAVFRPSSGTWYTSTVSTNNFGAIQFGANGDTPVAADFDGDGRVDAAVFRPATGAWYLNRTSQGFTGAAFGASEDKPIEGAYIR